MRLMQRIGDFEEAGSGRRIAGLLKSGLRVATCLVCAVGWGTVWCANGAEPAAEVEVLMIEGRVVCLPEAMHERFNADLPGDHAHVWGFAAADGRSFQLLRTALSEALFVDDRLRERRLLLKGRLYPGTHILDVTQFWSVKNGKVHELYYWCEVCVIKSVVPGECMCCQEPVELVERLVGVGE